MTDPPPKIERVVVVVPARDERATIGACVASIDRAAGQVDCPVDIVVVADSCRDDTSETAAAVRCQAAAALQVVKGRWAAPGPARRAGTASALGLGSSLATTWIASTDADTVVPATWLARQVAFANDGADVVIGVVALPDDVPAVLAARFEASYEQSFIGPLSHPHVHAANLGVRAGLYVQAGGWSPDITVGEEHDLVSRLLQLDATIVRTIAAPVVTSARLRSRIDGGFATDLAGLLAG